MADAVTEVTEAYIQKLNSVAPGAIWIQLGLMSAVGAGALGLFVVLRPNNSVIYQPKIKYSEDGKRPPRVEKTPMGWVEPVLKTPEAALLGTIGCDAVVFLRFIRMCRNIFIAMAALSCLVLIPINVVYNLKYVKSESRTYITMLTINAVSGNWLWAHVAITYIVTFIVFFFLWMNYNEVIKLRWAWFRSEEYQNSLHARSLLITQVQKGQKSDQGIASLLSSLQIPYPTTAVHIGRKVGALPELIQAHNDTVRALEGVLTTYFKNPDKLPSKRPTMRIGGTLGMGGKVVDAIDYLTEKIKRYDERIEITRRQIDERKAENYGFASFESVPYAHIVAKKLEGKRKMGSKFQMAPQPADIIWENIGLLDSQRRGNKFMGSILLVVFCGLYTIPLLGVSILANIAALSAYVGFINTWTNDYPWLMSAFVGTVPSLLSVLLQLLLPRVIRWISKGQGATTHSQNDRQVTARYSAFLIITQFFIFSVIGVIVNVISTVVIDIQGNKSASTILAAIKKLPDSLQNTWVIQSSYWLTVFPLRGASALFDLAQIVSLIFIWFRTKLFGRTPREIREWTKPQEFDYAVFFSNHILMVVVGFVYTPLAPLVPLFAACAFAVSIWVYKYQLMYVFVSRVETGGRLWRVAVNRVLVALVLMHALMLLTVGLQLGWYNSISLVPCAFMVLIFKLVLKNQFDMRFQWFIPSEQEMQETYLHQADARKGRLQKRFGHPSLHDPLFTPMLHKDTQHLLPTIYSGRVGQGHGAVDGKEVTQNIAGGLTFNMLESHDLAYDRAAYLRQRDEDAMTVSTAAAFAGKETGGPPGGDYFEQRRQQYLNHGPDFMSRDAQTPDDLPVELSRMPTGESTENLIPTYPPRYGSPQARHAHNFSQHSFASTHSFGDPYAQGGAGAQDVEMVQQYSRGGYAQQQAPRPDSRGEDSRPSSRTEQYRPDSRTQTRTPPPFGQPQGQAQRAYQPHHASSLSQQSFEGYPPPNPNGNTLYGSPPNRQGGIRPTYDRVESGGRLDE
ncbi:hypothetical protein MNV49_001808 [Pseudohyphozyma bogoriensis]|nr:hypothetical protein MNV49_001808 [Pseudohyphozyma bogoriensis]